jgi:2-C-methyl-D-erythritol 4-phosphate cytidylyltransferase
MNVAIIVAAGAGTRAAAGGMETRKQFRELAGLPVLVHTLRRFEEAGEIGATIAVVPESEIDRALALARAHGIAKLASAVAGGASRTESVRLGLRAVDLSAEIVAVHDGVRPFVTAAEIDATVRAAAPTGAAVLVAPVIDTVKEIAGGSVARTLARERLRRALTPQCFRLDLLRRAYERAVSARLEATDDSALVERLGVEVRTVEGDPRNIKLTRPEDFALAEILLKGLGAGG